MSATPPAEIQAAIAATRAAGTAKIRRGVRRDTAAGVPSLADEGVADLAGGRAHLASDWDDVWQGELHYERFDGEWRAERVGDDFGDRQSHPLWLLRGGIGWRPEVEDLGPAEMNGRPVRRLGARIYPLVPRDWDSESQDVEVWVDTKGRVRLAAVRRPPVTAPAPPEGSWLNVLVNLAGTPEHPLWSTVELWRFGVEVSLPEPPPGLRPAGLARQLRDAVSSAPMMWRHRREIADAFREIRDGEIG